MRRVSAGIVAVLAAGVILAAVSILAQSALTVIYPNGGETLYKWYSYPLRWEDSRTGPQRPETVLLSVYIADAQPFYFLEDYETDNDSLHWWTVPAVEEWSENCYFKVADPVGPGAHSDVSDGPFTIRYLGDPP